MYGKRILLPLIVLTLFFCCFTGCTKSDTTETTRTPENSEQAESRDSNETKAPEVKDACAGSWETSTGDIFSYAIPRIDLSGSEIDTLNESIYQEFYADNLDENGVYHGAIIDYNWCVNGNVLTLIVHRNYELEFGDYSIYSIRINTAHVMTPEEFLAEAGLTTDEFEAQASIVLGNAYCVWLKEYIAQNLDSDERIMTQFKKTVSDENAAKVVPFFDENGVLCFCGKIYQIAGASYHEEILPLTGYEVSEFYDVLLSKAG